VCAGGEGELLMPTTEYYQKQIELLLLWAAAATNRDLQTKLIQRACELLALADCTDDQTLRLFEKTLDSVLRNHSPTPATIDRLGRGPPKETPGSF
jgi:hypothetical protein